MIGDRCHEVEPIEIEFLEIKTTTFKKFEWERKTGLEPRKLARCC